MAGIAHVKDVEPRPTTILAAVDPVERLAEQASVLVWRRRHLRVIEKRAESA